MTGNHGPALVTLPADNQILITRAFAAPERLVWRAVTEPELIKRWWVGQRGVATDVQVDLRVGGEWRQAMRTNGGFEVAFHGVFREVKPYERVVRTEIFDAAPEAEALTTMTLTEVDGVTTLQTLVEHLTRENRDLHLGYGMEGGMNEAFDLLETLLAALA